MAPTPIAAWHQLVKAHDPSGLDALLADEVVFYSPVVRTPQRGKMLATLYLQGAFHVFINETFHYVREVISERDAALEFEVTIDEILINGVDLIRWNDAGQIVDFKVMLRPLKAVHLIHQKMGELLKAFSTVAKP